MQAGDIVFHAKFGEGTVRAVLDTTALVRFEAEIHECLLGDLMPRSSVASKLAAGKFDATLPAVCRMMASAIRSVNDEWGVFSTSRIALLPHQLWVCRRVLEEDPARWLVADDVGLGKTIEAGLVLSSLRSANRLRRCLILAPASLISQWQERLMRMFDLRFEVYHTANDNPRSNQFWRGERLVIASMQTLGMDNNNRIKRLLESEAWDLVIVDEAHRLNKEERSKGTLAYQLVTLLLEQQKIHSLLFFTGTPHKGKEHNFFALLSLLRPDLFEDPDILPASAYGNIPKVMLRNNKQKVTDMSGNKLFEPVEIRIERYSYSEEEAKFYDTLSTFIATGRIYANQQESSIQKVIFFILTTIQKLASSSIAAVKKALKNRLAKLENKSIEQIERDALGEDWDAFEDGQADSDADAAVKLSPTLPEEIDAIRQLIGYAEQITHETKMDQILETISQTYANGESILFFTEYKATQALLVELLRKKYGKEAVVFINGDNALDLRASEDKMETEYQDRWKAAEKFNNGSARFLVSTEAAGEGIDLQENSHVLFHVDLPWNPMRLHQRLGRLHRYGQKHKVYVHMFRNPDTVEGRIWSQLEAKLAVIIRAFSGMDDPEDMCMAVIGTASNSYFTNLFANAPKDGGQLKSWFDAQTSTFGGQDAVEYVRKIYGQVSSFDFGNYSANLPQVDLQDLLPYIRIALARMGQRPRKGESALKLSFKTPKEFAKILCMAPEYNLVFSRDFRCADDEDMAGLGLAIIDQFVNDGTSLTENCAHLPGLDAPLFIFRIRDRTTENKQYRQRMVAVAMDQNNFKIMRDWELLKYLNGCSKGLSQQKEPGAGLHPAVQDLDQAKVWLEENLALLNLPYRSAEVEAFGCLCPDAPALTAN